MEIKCIDHENRAMHPTMAWNTNELFCYFISMYGIDVYRQQLFPFLFAEWNIASSISFDDAWYIYNRIWLSCGAEAAFSHFFTVSSIEQTFGNNIIISNSFLFDKFSIFSFITFLISLLIFHGATQKLISILYTRHTKRKIWRGLILH